MRLQELGIFQKTKLKKANGSYSVGTFYGINQQKESFCGWFFSSQRLLSLDNPYDWKVIENLAMNCQVYQFPVNTRSAGPVI